MFNLSVYVIRQWADRVRNNSLQMCSFPQHMIRCPIVHISWPSLIVTPRLALSCDMRSWSKFFVEWSRIRASVRWCTSIKSSLTQDWCEWKCQVVDTTSGCETKSKVRVWLGMWGKYEGPQLWEAEDEKPSFGTTQEFPMWWRLCHDCGRSQVYRTS